MVCTNCGMELQPLAMFCSGCGAKVVSSGTPSAVSDGTITKSSKSMRYILVGVAVIAVVLLVSTLNSGGIPNGRFYFDSVVSEVEFAIHPYGDFFEFRGNQVTVSNLFLFHGVLTTGQYTYSHGYISIEAQGNAVIEFGIEVVDRNTLLVTLRGVEYMYVRDARPEWAP